MTGIRQVIEFEKFNEGQLVIDNLSDREIKQETITDLQGLFIEAFGNLPIDLKYRLELKILKFSDWDELIGCYSICIGQNKEKIIGYCQAEDLIQIIIIFLNFSYAKIKNSTNITKNQIESSSNDQKINHQSADDSTSITKKGIARLFDRLFFGL